MTGAEGVTGEGGGVRKERSRGRHVGAGRSGEICRNAKAGNVETVYVVGSASGVQDRQKSR